MFKAVVGAAHVRGHVAQPHAAQPKTTQPNTAALSWYVCVTKPRQETYATSKLQEQGYEVYLPMLASWARQSGAWHKKQTVMFPRYCFVRPAVPGQAIGPVRNTPGITRLVSFGPTLACLSVDRVECLRLVVASREACVPDQPIPPGQHVLFTAGPLKGVAGIVSSTASERVLVMISLLGRDQTVAVDVEQLALG